MIRIAGGAWRGRRLRAPRGLSVRPTQERVRESLFAVLGERTEGARVLDLFAGTGALGLEAVSRGAARAVLVDHDRRSLRTIRENVASLGEEATATTTVLDVDLLARGAAARIAERAGDAGPFELVLMDPPWDLLRAARGEAAATVGALPAALAAAGLLAEGATVVVEHGARERPKLALEGGLALEDERRYGETGLILLRFAAPRGESART